MPLHKQRHFCIVQRTVPILNVGALIKRLLRLFATNSPESKYVITYCAGDH